ncbi:hypothetical protein C8J56DRAFT_388250 [Mycena floridula]|nr:hypothetical protein C8J56DRAFT_388250 [Mycena floridula]
MNLQVAKSPEWGVTVSHFRSTSRIDGGIASDNTAKSGRSFSVLVEDSQVADVGGGIACGNQFNTEKLVPGPPGEKMSMQAFCKKYDLSHTILNMLMKHGYETARALCYLAVEELEDMGFKTGHVAALREATKEWSWQGMS